MFLENVGFQQDFRILLIHMEVMVSFGILPPIAVVYPYLLHVPIWMWVDRERDILSPCSGSLVISRNIKACIFQKHGYIPVIPGNTGFSKSRSVHIRGLKVQY